LDAHAACNEAHCQGVLRYMQEREHKWDALQEHNALWEVGITHMIENVMKGAVPDWKAREQERDKAARLDGGGLEHQQNVKQSGSHMQASQTLRSTSPVFLSNSRRYQALLELSKVLSDAARTFSGAPESTCSYGGAFKMLHYLTYPLDRNFGIPGPFGHGNRLPTCKYLAMQPQLCGVAWEHFGKN